MQDIDIEKAAAALGGGRRGRAKARIALTGTDAAGVWAAALCKESASEEELRDTAELIAWQGVSGAEKARQRWRALISAKCQ